MECLDREEDLSHASLDEDETPFGESERRRQYLIRRLTAIGGGILVLILIILAVRGCLDARQQRAYENYVADLTVLAGESDQLSESFFALLGDPQQLSDLSFEAQVNAAKGTAEDQLRRVQSLDAPGGMSAAQGNFVLTFEFRRDGLAAIAEQVKTATGEEGANKAAKQITQQMQTFLASDVLYRMGRARANTVLTEQAIAVEVPTSQFLPSLDWLDEATVSTALAGVTGGAVGDVSGVHGLGLVSTSISGVVLLPGAESTVTVAGRPELQVSVQNQGEAEESDIGVSFTLSGGGQTISGKEAISALPAGETETVILPVSPAPPQGQALTLEVVVDTVPGEQVADNNRAEYTIVFQ
jgi:hypothetical protein